MLAFALPTFSPTLYGSLVGGLIGLVLLAIFGRVPIQYSLRNLIVRWRTTLLTSLAFTLVIGLMIVMLAFVNGMSRLTEQSGQPGNVIVLSDGAIDELFSNFKYTETSDVERQPGVLRDENNRPMCSRETYLVAIQDTGTEKDNRPQRRFVQLRAIEDPEMAARIHGIGLYPGGQWFSEAGVQNDSRQNRQGIGGHSSGARRRDCPRNGARSRPGIAEGRRSVRTRRPHVDCGGHHQIGRLHVRLRSVGQVEPGFAPVRQGALHFDGGAHRRRRHRPKHWPTI